VLFLFFMFNFFQARKHWKNGWKTPAVADFELTLNADIPVGGEDQVL
jgi:hypothetical protein